MPYALSEVLMDDEINLLDYWNVLWRRKGILITLFTVAVVATMVASLLLPKYYKAEAVIIASGSEAGGLGAALTSIPLAGVLAASAGIQTPTDKVMVVLNSRTLAESVIERFNLLRVFNENQWDQNKGTWKDANDPPLMQDAVAYLTEDVVETSKNKESAITITVKWKDPKLAADIANYYVTALSRFLNDKAINVTIQVVDRAIPAEKKYSPKISVNMVLAGATSIFIGVFIAFFLEYLEKSREQRKDG